MRILSLQASPSTDQAAVARFRAALAAREEVEAHLESELAAARAQAASYEHRRVPQNVPRVLCGSWKGPRCQPFLRSSVLSLEAHIHAATHASPAQCQIVTVSVMRRIRQLEGRLLRSAMRTSPSASMRGSGRSSSSPSSSFSGAH